jgi:hypothetical protein
MSMYRKWECKQHIVRIEKEDSAGHSNAQQCVSEGKKEFHVVLCCFEYSQIFLLTFGQLCYSIVTNGRKPMFSSLLSEPGIITIHVSFSKNAT